MACSREISNDGGLDISGRWQHQLLGRHTINCYVLASTYNAWAKRQPLPPARRVPLAPNSTNIRAHFHHGEPHAWRLATQLMRIQHANVRFDRDIYERATNSPGWKANAPRTRQVTQILRY